MRYFIIATSIVLAVLVGSCERRTREYPVPGNARTATNGMKYAIVRAGDGPVAKDGGIWGVKWTLLSHTTRGCEYPCVVERLHPTADSRFEPWRDVLATMREGEVRRVWVKWPDEADVKTYDVELLSVVRTDNAGNPVYDNPYPNLRKPLPHETSGTSPTATR